MNPINVQKYRDDHVALIEWITGQKLLLYQKLLIWAIVRSDKMGLYAKSRKMGFSAFKTPVKTSKY
jgi:hypothetical protein